VCAILFHFWPIHAPPSMHRRRIIFGRWLLCW
jgi:hypothetical protein